MIVTIDERPLTYTRYRMHVLEHIPTRYYVDPELMHHQAQLYDEIARHGRILLDDAGQPACLTGKVPQLLRYWPELHGPWKP